MKGPETPLRCFLCGSRDFEPVAEIRSRPARETDFKVPADKYRRLVYRCRACTVFWNAQDMVTPEIYKQDYNRATYQEKLAATYERIRGLPLEKSDNKQRVMRVMRFLDSHARPESPLKVLDVGSGLCVFLGELKERGYRCFAIDPDPLSCRHAMERAGVEKAHAGTLDDFSESEKFHLITFNKVLEHVPDPVRVLAKARSFLAPGGWVYVELPDGDAAIQNGGAVEREEFFIEHHTVFTPASLDFLARTAGFRSGEQGRLHEPSDKYTLYAFLSQVSQ